MKILYALFALAVALFLSCKEPKPAAKPAVPAPPQKTKTVTTGVSTAPVDVSTIPIDNAVIEPDGSGQKLQDVDSMAIFIVSFYSAGGGVDRGEPEKLMAYTEAFGKKINTTIAYSITHWGREGEMDYCFPLKGLSDSNVADFVKGAKEALKSAEHVHFLGNQVCRAGR